MLEGATEPTKPVGDLTMPERLKNIQISQADHAASGHTIPLLVGCMTSTYATYRQGASGQLPNDGNRCRRRLSKLVITNQDGVSYRGA